MHLPVKITQTGVLNSVVFWFELQMEKPDKPDEKERSGVEDEEEDEEDDDGAGVGMPAASPEQASPDPANLPCCASCCQAKPKAEYSKNQWSKKEARRCKSCVGLGVADPSQTDATEEPVAKATAAAAVADPAVVLSTGPENPILGTHWLQVPHRPPLSMPHRPPQLRILPQGSHLPRLSAGVPVFRGDISHSRRGYTGGRHA